jgi:histidinol-phosphate/aromatic aminotransferase/cobyric acid decarboxylase-like protein
MIRPRDDVAALRPVNPASANFVLVVRDCRSFGLPGHLRIGLRPVEECARLVAAFGALR